MKMGTELWAAHVAAVKLEAISASEFAHPVDQRHRALRYSR